MPTQQATRDRSISPPVYARRRGVKPEKILAFIYSGELRAVNFATPGSSRPRWKISPEAIEEFEASRAAVPPVKRVKNKPRKADPAVVKFF